jgi:hypothetical protein
LCWLLDTSVPKKAEIVAFHIAVAFNLRQAYASFLNSRQFNKVRVDKNLPYFIFDFVLKISFLRKGYGVRSGKEMSKVAHVDATISLQLVQGYASSFYRKILLPGFQQFDVSDSAFLDWYRLCKTKRQAAHLSRYLINGVGE